MSAGRGRGFALTDKLRSAELRRPGDVSPIQKLSNASLSSALSNGDVENFEDKFSKICDKISQLNVSSPADSSNKNAEEDIVSLCNTPEKLEKFAEHIFQFGLKTRWNAHATAVFIHHHGSITVETVKLRTWFLRRLKSVYDERVKNYSKLEHFLLEVFLFSEIFNHVHIADACLTILVRPLIDYFGMLVDGASHKEIEVFVEQFPKCFKNLKENHPEGIDSLVLKIRKEIASETTTVTVRAMLLEMLEMVLTDWKQLDAITKQFYESLSKPIVKIC